MYQPPWNTEYPDPTTNYPSTYIPHQQQHHYHHTPGDLQPQYHQSTAYYPGPANFYPNTFAYHQPQPQSQYPQTDMSFAWMHSLYHLIHQLYSPQPQYPLAWTYHPSQQQTEAYPTHHAQPARVSQPRPIRPKPSVPKVPHPPLSSTKNQARPPPPPLHLILKSEPKLDILLQPLSKAVTPKLPQKEPSTTQPSEKLLPVGPETLQVGPNAVQLCLLPAGTGDSSTAAEPVQPLPQAQTSQLAPPMPSAQAKVPKLSNSALLLPD